ncbi:hypothetical protein [Hyphomicrobium sp. ghe19]|nr:hypothetical protein HYPP_01517 [Hyphomicrobium sp. ghe19]
MKLDRFIAKSLKGIDGKRVNLGATLRLRDRVKALITWMERA